MTPQDDFRRDRDPRTRRNAVVVGVVLAAGLVALLAGVWVARSQPTAAPPAATPGAPTAPVAQTGVPTPPSLSPSPVPAKAVLGSRFSAAYDARTHQLVTFGGVDSYDTTWLFDGRRWTLARPPTSPPGRFNAAAAYDPLTGLVMVYGGRLGPGQLVADTWAWDGRTWRQLDAGTATMPSYASMAWDDTLNQMVLVDNAGTNAGTWTWDGTHWVRQPRGDLPPATSLIGMAVDPVTHALLGVSCCSEGRGDTATLLWDGAAWRQPAIHTVPGFTVSLVRDPVSTRLLMFGDPTVAPAVWTWTGADWMQLPKARVPVFPAAAVTDAATHQVVIVGSVAEPTQGNPQPVQVWSLNGSAWQQLG